MLQQLLPKTQKIVIGNGERICFGYGIWVICWRCSKFNLYRWIDNIIIYFNFHNYYHTLESFNTKLTLECIILRLKGEGRVAGLWSGQRSTYGSWAPAMAPIGGMKIGFLEHLLALQILKLILISIILRNRSLLSRGFISGAEIHRLVVGI